MTIEPRRSPLQRFIGELRRRHVVRTAIAYAAVAFVVLQLAEIVIPAFFPGMRSDEILRLIVVVAVLIFPVLMALAWIYEITPQGVRSMSDLDADAGVSIRAGIAPRVALLVLTLLATSSAGLWWWTTSEEAAEPRRLPPATSTFQGAATTSIDAPVRSVAVLPLEALSETEGDEYFAPAMHEAIIAYLSQVPGLRVISRTSVQNFDARGLSVPQIGEALSVDAVIEGSVLRVGNEMRLTVQLIHAASDTHLWADSYERTLENIISVQRELAEAIAMEVADNTGSATEGVRMAGIGSNTEPMTAPVDAQEALLRGRFALSRAGDPGLDSAANFFADAIRRDSVFAPALVGLAAVELSRSQERGADDFPHLFAARDLASQALRIDATSVEGNEVMASISRAIAEEVSRTGRAIPGRGQEALPVGVTVEGDSLVRLPDGGTIQLERPGVSEISVRTTELGRFAEQALGEGALSEDSGLTTDQRIQGVLRLVVGDRLDRASEMSERATTDDPESAELWEIREQIARISGRLEEVIQVRQERDEAVGASPGTSTSELAVSVRRRGMSGYWDWKLQEFESGGVESFPSLHAAALLASGREAEALELLGRAATGRDRSLAFLRVDPVWDPVRDSETFGAIVDELRQRRPPDGRSR